MLNPLQLQNTLDLRHLRCNPSRIVSAIATSLDCRTGEEDAGLRPYVQPEPQGSGAALTV